jgi:O-acetylserine/cysteine efflux transporter
LWLAGVGVGRAGFDLFCYVFNSSKPIFYRGDCHFFFVLTLSGAAAWAVSNIVARQAQRSHALYDPLAFVVWSALIPILSFALLSPLLDEPGSWAQFAAAAWQAWAVAALAVTLLGEHVLRDLQLHPSKIS